MKERLGNVETDDWGGRDANGASHVPVANQLLIRVKDREDLETLQGERKASEGRGGRHIFRSLMVVQKEVGRDRIILISS